MKDGQSKIVKGAVEFQNAASKVKCRLLPALKSQFCADRLRVRIVRIRGWCFCQANLLLLRP
jgi:hypothetical protein